MKKSINKTMILVGLVSVIFCDTKLKKLCFVIKSFFSKLFCLHEWGETICGGIHYSYRECHKCGKIQNNGSSWD